MHAVLGASATLLQGGCCCCVPAGADDDGALLHGGEPRYALQGGTRVGAAAVDALPPAAPAACTPDAAAAGTASPSLRGACRKLATSSASVGVSRRI